MAETISTAVALIAAFILGYGLRGERERQKARRPKTLKRLMREQGIKPVRSIADLPAADPALFDDEDWAAWDAALREARGGD